MPTYVTHNTLDLVPVVSQHVSVIYKYMCEWLPSSFYCEPTGASKQKHNSISIQVINIKTVSHFILAWRNSIIPIGHVSQHTSYCELAYKKKVV